LLLLWSHRAVCAFLLFNIIEDHIQYHCLC
jgi:hypothetical protein